MAAARITTFAPDPFQTTQVYSRTLLLLEKLFKQGAVTRSQRKHRRTLESGLSAFA